MIRPRNARDLGRLAGLLGLLTLVANGAAQPLRWPVDAPRILEDYGRCEAPGPGTFRPGIDLTSAQSPATNTAVLAAAAGTVLLVNNTCTAASDRTCGGGFGNFVVLRHGEQLYSLYAYLGAVAVQVDQTVTPGQILGLMGSTGDTPEPRLHFALQVARPATPADFAPTYTVQPPANLGFPDPRDYFPKTPIRVKATTLMVRRGPATDEPALTWLLQGQEFVAIAQSSNNWYLLFLPSSAAPTPKAPAGDHYGWVSGAFLEPLPTPPAAPVQVNSQQLWKNNALTLRVRAGPGKGCGEVTTVWGGQCFMTLGSPTPGPGSTQPWCQIHLPVNAGATEGWLAGDYLVPATTPPDFLPPASSAFTATTNSVAPGQPITVATNAGSGLGTVAVVALTNVSITVQANPSTCSYAVDGVTYTNDHTFTWSAGSSHTLTTTSPQAGPPGVQYAWTGWSDGGALAHTITPTQSTNYSATFAIEFYLTTEAAAGGTVTPASGWQASGAVVPLLASPAQDYRFLGWQGNGPGAYSGTNRATALTLHGPVTELATFAAIPPPPTATPSVSATNVVSPPEPTPAVAKELALLNAPAPEPLAKPAAARPPDVTPLLAEAQRHLAARKFDQAQDKYLEALRQDEKNVAALANLATLQLELNRLADAEGHFKQALALAPEDPTTLLNFGRLQFQQKKYAEARDALNHAAKLEPKNAKVQNLLGLVLMEQGARGPAEKAFRKAIELQPGYGNAHHNLAVLFLTQQPPFVEMARWHYQKALQLDAPRDPDLEKMLNPVQP